MSHSRRLSRKGVVNVNHHIMMVRSSLIRHLWMKSHQLLFNRN